MFLTKMTLKEFDKYVGFWGGAQTIWASLSDEEIEYLEEVCDGYTFINLTQINDFMWFDAADLIEEYRQDCKED